MDSGDASSAPARLPPVAAAPGRSAGERIAALVTTLTLAMAASTFAQVVFGALGPFLTSDLRLSRTQLGTLTTALYLTGALLSPVAGRLVDRFKGRILLVALFVLNIVSLLAVAAAPSYRLLLAAALFAGLAVAIGNPVTNLLVATHVPVARQGLATGVKQSGVQLGVFAGGAALPSLAAVAGWRAATLAGLLVPALGLAWTVAAVPRDELQVERRAVARARLPVAVPWLTTYALGMGAGISAIGAYVPLYGVERLGLSASTAGLLAALIGGVGVVARVAWGRAADRYAAPVALSLLALALASIVSAVLLLAAEGRGAWLAWAAAAIAGASAAAWNAVGMLAIVRGVDLAVAGRASGVVVLSFYLGFVLGPSAFGAIVDASGSYRPAWLAVAAAFALSAAVAGLWSRSAARR